MSAHGTVILVTVISVSPFTEERLENKGVVRLSVARGHLGRGYAPARPPARPPPPDPPLHPPGRLPHCAPQTGLHYTPYRAGAVPKVGFFHSRAALAARVSHLSVFFVVKAFTLSTVQSDRSRREYFNGAGIIVI